MTTCQHPYPSDEGNCKQEAINGSDLCIRHALDYRAQPGDLHAGIAHLLKRIERLERNVLHIKGMAATGRLVVSSPSLGPLA